jgi:hypothetical protein
VLGIKRIHTAVGDTNDGKSNKRAGISRGRSPPKSSTRTSKNLEATSRRKDAGKDDGFKSPLGRTNKTGTQSHVGEKKGGNAKSQIHVHASVGERGIMAESESATGQDGDTSAAAGEGSVRKRKVRLSLCICACMHCMHACMHVCECVCVHICVCACVHACMHVCMYVRVCAYV